MIDRKGVLYFRGVCHSKRISTNSIVMGNCGFDPTRLRRTDMKEKVSDLYEKITGESTGLGNLLRKLPGVDRS